MKLRLIFNSFSSLPANFFRIYPAIGVPVMLSILLPQYGYATDIYTWEDENGKIYYGDRHPGDDVQKLEITELPAVGDTDEQRKLKQRRLLEIFKEEREEKKVKQTDQLTEKKLYKANCIKASETLEHIQNARFIYKKTDDPLNPDVLSSEERVELTKEIEAQVKRWCK